jgi:hypothetical protein
MDTKISTFYSPMDSDGEKPVEPKIRIVEVWRPLGLVGAVQWWLDTADCNLINGVPTRPSEYHKRADLIKAMLVNNSGSDWLVKFCS